MNNSTQKKKYIRIVFFLFLAAVLIRTVKFGSVPGGMNQDGAMAAVDAKALAEYGTDRLGMRWPVHLTAWGFGQMSSLMSYLMAPFLKAFGLNIMAARIPSLLVSLGGLVCLFFFAKKTGGQKYSLIVLFFAALNPWHILQSRWALDCNLFPHFLMAGMLFLLYGTEKKVLLYVSMLFFGLSMYCYGISLYTVPPFLLAACVYLVCKKEISVSDALKCAGCYLLISWPFFTCMILNTLGLDTIETPLFTIPFFPDSLRSGDILFFSGKPLNQLGKNLKSTFRILFQTYGGSLCNEVKGFGTMYPISVPFLLIGTVHQFRLFRKNTGSAFSVLMFLTGLFDGIITANVNINRINLIFYPMLLFICSGLQQTILFMGKRSGMIRQVTAAVLAAVYLASFFFFSYAYFTSYAKQISENFMQDFGQALSAVKGEHPAKFCITPDAQYKGFWYVSEILTLFYHDIDAEFYQSDAFHEQYAFRNPEDGELPSSDTVYVTTEEYTDLFSGDIFQTEQYGRFFTAVPK